MNAAPRPPGPVAPAAPPPSSPHPAARGAATERLPAPQEAPLSGVLEAIARSTAPRRITLLAGGGGRLALLAENGALVGVEGADGPPAESGKARAARLAAVIGGFCAAAASGGTIRARVEAVPEGEGRTGLASFTLPVPSETLAGLAPALPVAQDGDELPAERERAARPDPADAVAAPEPPPDPAATEAMAEPMAEPAVEPMVEPATELPSDPAGDPQDDLLGDALCRLLGETQALAAALPGAGIAWVATRAEAAGGGGRLAVRTGEGDGPAILPRTGAGEAAAVLDAWIAEALGADLPNGMADVAEGDAEGAAP